MKTSLRRLNDRGITLIEIMGSVLIFMTCTGALMSTMIASKKLSLQSANAYDAYNLAKKRVELLKSVAFTAVANASESDIRIDADGEDDPDGDYSRTTVVTPNYDGRDDLTQVDVTVYYTLNGEFSPTPMEVTTVLVDTTSL